VPAAAGHERGEQQARSPAPGFHAHAFAAATFGAEFTGPLPDDPEPEPEPPEPESPEPELVLAGADGVALSDFAAGFASPPSEGFPLLDE
jgi:hypothetical protein